MAQEKKKETVNRKEEDAVSVLSGWEEAEHDIPQLPAINVNRDFVIAKSYLQKIGCRNETIWDHLTDILNHVMNERPQDCMRYFEDLSRELRIKKFFLNKDCDSLYKELPGDLKEADDSKQLLHFYRKVECLYESDNPFEDKFGSMDLLPMFRLLNEAGVGFQYSEIYNIQMAIKLIVKLHPVTKIKLWGKVFGTMRDYIILEVELTPEAMVERTKKFNERLLAALHKKDESGILVQTPPDAHSFTPHSLEQEEYQQFEQDLDEELESAVVFEAPKRKLDLYIKPPLPTTPTPVEIIIPPEAPGVGVNKKVYFVANEANDDWYELPDVTPRQIVKARQLHRYLTGILSKEVPGYPKFPGREKHYLRAQIARITAATHASPLGFYSTGGEEEAVELEEGQLYTENVDYQPIPVRDLIDPTLQFWVHHEPYLLQQGRVEFWQEPSAAHEEDVEEEGYANRAVEKGPPILTSLSEDVFPHASTPPWTVRRASTLLNEDTVVVLRSQQWPGALTAVKDRLFVNFYVGYATKSFPRGYTPYMATKVQSEYELGPEIMEIADPTVEMEEARWLELHKTEEPVADLGEEEGEGEAEVEEV